MKYVAVIGSRSFNDYVVLCAALDKLVKSDDVIVSGGARGADELAERYAKEHNLQTIIHLPDWKTYGRAAGFVRNKKIVNDADIVIAFHDGFSKGTQNSIDLAKRTNKPTMIIEYGTKM